MNKAIDVFFNELCDATDGEFRKLIHEKLDHEKMITHYGFCNICYLKDNSKTSKFVKGICVSCGSDEKEKIRVKHDSSAKLTCLASAYQVYSVGQRRKTYNKQNDRIKVDDRILFLKLKLMQIIANKLYSKSNDVDTFRKKVNTKLTELQTKATVTPAASNATSTAAPASATTTTPASATAAAPASAPTTTPASATTTTPASATTTTPASATTATQATDPSAAPASAQSAAPTSTPKLEFTSNGTTVEISIARRSVTSMKQLIEWRVDWDEQIERLHYREKSKIKNLVQDNSILSLAVKSGIQTLEDLEHCSDEEVKSTIKSELEKLNEEE
ncbi:hypothetical protein N9N11_00945 [Candidatus Poseidoniales archaeon]|nr:hypothetical protein [Candidatus Poseidoniales archaeon]